MMTMGGNKPTIAVIDGNTLAAIGLKTILQRIMSAVDIKIFGTFDDFYTSNYDIFFHFFVSLNVVLKRREFFLQHRRKSIVLTTNQEGLSAFHCINVNVSEDALIKSLLKLEQYAHAEGRNLPAGVPYRNNGILTDREIEILVLIVEGYINKEIAEKLHVGLTTIISHRKNIMNKLDAKSVSALTIYAVTQGYVDIGNI